MSEAGTVAHSHNLNTQEAEAGRSPRAQDQPRRYSQYQTTLGYRVGHYLKNVFCKRHHHPSEEAAYRTGKIFTSSILNRDLVSRIYEELFHIKKTNNTILKWSMNQNTGLSKDEIQLTEKCLVKV